MAPVAEPTKAVPEAPLDASQPVPVKGKWNPVLYGFVEADFIHDFTQSFNELAGNGLIQRDTTYAGKHGRTMFSVRNSRIGFKLAAPETQGFKPTAVLEMDFLGNQPSDASEGQLFGNPTFRIRHFALKIEDPYVDVLVGQYWQLFGWQSYFHPNTVEIQGAPGQVYSRAPQFRLSRTFKTDPVNVEIAVAAVRPPERNAEAPDGQAGLRLLLNHYKGLRTAGSTGTSIDSASIGVSGTTRRFRVPKYEPGTTSSVTTTGSGISVDVLLPVIPATEDDRGNALTFTGSFVTGAGISDLYTGLNGGASLPATFPKAADGTAAPYASGLDNGLAIFDATHDLHAVKWQSYIVGLQYYLPPSGKVWISANYSHMKSDNIADYTTEAAARGKLMVQSDWVDGNVFVDPLPAVRFGLEYAYFHQKFADDATAKNHRVQFSGFFMF